MQQLLLLLAAPGIAVNAARAEGVAPPSRRATERPPPLRNPAPPHRETVGAQQDGVLGKPGRLKQVAQAVKGRRPAETTSSGVGVFEHRVQTPPFLTQQPCTSLHQERCRREEEGGEGKREEEGGIVGEGDDDLPLTECL